MAHKGHAEKKKDRCKQKSNAAHEKGNLCKQKKKPLQTKKEKPQRGEEDAALWNSIVESQT